ncbi:MAG: hypothetical protein ACRDDZ_04190 [Marinifilaceae bacterium]
MRKINLFNISIPTLLLSAFLTTGCNEEVIKTEFDKEIPTLPTYTQPGSEYIKDGETCLNVFYLIPMEIDTIADWHRRLSGITMNMQDYIRENFEYAGLGSKTFNLNKNKDSKDHIKIHLLRSEKVSIYSEELQMNDIMREITDYWKENPGTQEGNNTLVYLPLYGGEAPFHGGYLSSGANVMVRDLSFGVVTVDHENFDLNYAGTLAGKAFLAELPAVIHELGHAFWVQHNNSAASTDYISLMNAVPNRYFETPRVLRFTPSDLLWMQELDVFKPKNDTQDFTQAYEISVASNSCVFANQMLHVDFRFTSQVKPAFVIVYNDPWLAGNENADRASGAFTEYDAVSYPITELSEENGVYSAKAVIDWKDYLDTVGKKLKKGEIRYRVVFEGGNAYPSAQMVKGFGPGVQTSKIVRFYYEIENNVPVFKN